MLSDNQSLQEEVEEAMSGVGGVIGSAPRDDCMFSRIANSDGEGVFKPRGPDTALQTQRFRSEGVYTVHPLLFLDFPPRHS